MLGLAVVLVLAATPSLAQATESLRVRVQRPLEEDALIDEAVNRAIGELGALGFDVEVLRRRTQPADLDVPGQLDPGTEGALVFARDGDDVLVSAWVAGGQHAFVQKFPGKEPRATGEVIAVSAVEALRGMLIESSREPRPLPEPAPASEPEPPPKASIVEPEPPTPEPRDPIVPPPSRVHLKAAGFLAPTAGVDAGLLPNLGATGSLLVGVGHFAVGAGVERLFYAGVVRDDAGSARIERQNVAGILHGDVYLAQTWEAFAELQAGVVSYTVKPEAAAGFLATQRSHSDLALGAGIGVTQWPLPYLGWFARVEALVLPKPIRVLMQERPVATLGSPAGTLSIGLAARVE
jgi:hypothetical protein